MLDLQINPATGLYFHRGGMLVALSVLFGLALWTLPVIGVYAGRRIQRVAEQDMTLMARGEMDPAGYALAHGSHTVGRALELVTYATTAFWLLAIALIQLAY